MTTGRNIKFGAFVRQEREEREIGLREMAKMIGVSPTYISKVERDEFPPPAEDKVRKIAEILNIDVDELLALAGKVSSDLSKIIRERPRELAALLRTTKGMSQGDVENLAREAEKSKDFVELTVSDKETRKKYTLQYSPNSTSYEFFLRNEEDEGMSMSEKNLFDILNRYFEEEF